MRASGTGNFLSYREYRAMARPFRAQMSRRLPPYQTALHGSGLEGVVRFGLPGDFAETWLPSALGQFKRAHPMVRIEASVDRNAILFERLDKGQLDLAMIFGGGQRSGAQRLATMPMVWIGGAEPAW